jgi:hypothetical protein
LAVLLALLVRYPKGLVVAALPTAAELQVAVLEGSPSLLMLEVLALSVAQLATRQLAVVQLRSELVEYNVHRQEPPRCRFQYHTE